MLLQWYIEEFSHVLQQTAENDYQDEFTGFDYDVRPMQSAVSGFLSEELKDIKTIDTIEFTDVQDFYKRIGKFHANAPAFNSVQETKTFSANIKKLINGLEKIKDNNMKDLWVFQFKKEFYTWLFFANRPAFFWLGNEHMLKCLMYAQTSGKMTEEVEEDDEVGWCAW